MQRTMSMYNLEFLTKFSKSCRDMETAELRTGNADMLMKCVYQLYEDTYSGKLPALPKNHPARWNSPLSPYTGDVDGIIPPADRAKLSLQEDKKKYSFNEVLDLFRNTVVENSPNMLSGYMFGSVCNSTNFMSALAQTLAAWMPIIPHTYMAGPGSCEVELCVINWFCDLVGYEDEACGYLASGASTATVHGFMAARNDRSDSSPNVPCERWVVYVSEMAHRANRVALNVIGLGKCQVRTIKVDTNFCMQTTLIKQAVEEDIQNGFTPFMIVGTAGTTDAGSIDPLNDLAWIAEKHHVWFHVDAAIGGPCMVSETAKALMQGIELSDSVSLDCHKVFFQPPGLGVILVREGRKLRKCMANDDPYYLQDSAKRYSPMDYTFEVTRPFRGLSFWFTMKVLGEDFHRDVVDEKLQLAQYTANKLKQIPFITIYGTPQLMIVLYRYEPPNGNHNEINSQFIINLKAQERMFNDATVIDGIIYQRLCFTAQRTHIEEVNELIELIKKTIQSLDHADKKTLG